MFVLIAADIAGFALARVTTRKGEFDPDQVEAELCELIFGYTRVRSHCSLSTVRTWDNTLRKQGR